MMDTGQKIEEVKIDSDNPIGRAERKEADNKERRSPIIHPIIETGGIAGRIRERAHHLHRPPMQLVEDFPIASHRTDQDAKDFSPCACTSS